MSRQASRGPGAAEALRRRFGRLRRRILASTAPIVWICALPGAGKTRLLRQLQSGAAKARFRDWIVLDRPSARRLRQALAGESGGQVGGMGPRLLVASRANEAAARLLLASRVYGRVDVIDDADLFLTAADLNGSDAGALLADTAGWPVLVDAWLAGRGGTLCRMLPDFLAAEVLPALPQALVTGLFAAAAVPLAAAAAQPLCGTTGIIHPLLRASDEGVVPGSRWVRSALLQLRSRPGAMNKALRDELTQLYRASADPETAITALIGIGECEQAHEVFQNAGGIFFGYRHGYGALERVLDRFGPQWERRSESLALSRLWLLIKSGRPREALVRLEAQYPGLPVDLRRLRLSHRPHALMLRLDISLDIDETPPVEVVTSWGRLEALLPPDDALARGLLFNTMAIGFLQAGALLPARQLAEEALAVYEQARSPYLAHYMHLHLCDLALRQSQLREATRHLALARAALATSGLAFNSETAILDSFGGRIAYEEGRFADCPADVEAILAALLRGDSWRDLVSTMAGHFVFSAFWNHGLRAALDRLEQCALTLSRRHGPTQDYALQLIRVRLLQVSRRHAEAGMYLEELPPASRTVVVAGMDVEEELIRLRQQVVQQRPAETLLHIAAALASRPGLFPRQVISLAILQAHLRHRSGEAPLVRRHLRVAMRIAAAEDLVGVLVEEGEFLERLLPLFIADPGPGNAGLADFAQRVRRLLSRVPSAPMLSRSVAGVSRQEHRVLSYLSDGYTNKQIAKALGLSASTVKFHLRNLFRKLGVAARKALVEAARRRGIAT